jgi:hypothetical protein
MPHRQRHRGAHPADRELFGPESLDVLRTAAADYAWLLDRGYAPTSSLKLVGDRWQLAQRQRTALMRHGCPATAARSRRAKELAAGRLAGSELLVDGFNILTTLEAALGGGLILAARDGAFRDLCSLHGTYRRVAETAGALELAAESLAELKVARCRWYFDQPVSNSGRMKGLVLSLARDRDMDWTADVVPSPDRVLAAATSPVATSDSAVLDRCGGWFNLARYAVERQMPQAWIVSLGGPPL